MGRYTQRGWVMFKYAPILGHGAGGFQAKKMDYVEEYKLNKYLHRYTYPHNEFLYQLVNRGIVGLIMLVLVFIGGGMFGAVLERSNFVAFYVFITTLLLYLATINQIEKS